MTRSFSYDGAPAGIEKNLIRASWSPNGDKVGAGGGDGSVAVWELDTKKLLYKLPGHRGTVNDMRFSPNATEPISKRFSTTCYLHRGTNSSIVVSASSDKTLLLGELGK